MVAAITLFILGLGLVRTLAFDYVAPPEGEEAAFQEKVAKHVCEASDEDIKDGAIQGTLNEEITEAAIEVA